MRSFRKNHEVLPSSTATNASAGRNSAEFEEQVKAVIEETCNGLMICPLSADRADLLAEAQEDPCPNHRFQLSVQYRCRKFVNEMITPKSVLEIPLNESRTVECPDESSIAIIAAGYYGINVPVPLPADPLSLCNQTTLNIRLQKLCDGELSCVIRANKSEYRCGDTVNHMKLIYGCGPKSDYKRNEIVEIHSGQSLAIGNCPSDFGFPMRPVLTSALFVEGENLRTLSSRSHPCQADVLKSVENDFGCYNVDPCQWSYPDKAASAMGDLCKGKRLRLLISYSCDQLQLMAITCLCAKSQVTILFGCFLKDVVFCGHH